MIDLRELSDARDNTALLSYQIIAVLNSDKVAIDNMLEMTKNASLAVRYAIIEDLIGTTYSLSRGSEVEQTELRNAALHKAVYKIIDEIFAQESTIPAQLATETDEKGISLLMLAAERQLDNIVELTLRYGANINEKCLSHGHRSKYHAEETAWMLALRCFCYPKLLAKLITDDVIPEAQEYIKTQSAEVARQIGLSTAQVRDMMQAALDAAIQLRPYYVELREFYKINAELIRGGLGVKTTDGVRFPVIPEARIRERISLNLKPSFKPYEHINAEYRSKKDSILNPPPAQGPQPPGL